VLPRRKCLVLAPAQPPRGHIELFESIARKFKFDLQYAADRQNRVDSMLQASFLIADISGNDPGLMYDIGVAHTIGKRVFLVTDNLDALTFDMAGNRAWLIDPSSDNQQIYLAMERFLATEQTIGPVRLFLGRHAFFGENLIVRRFAAFVIDVLLIALVLALALFFLTGDQHTITDKIDFLVGQFGLPQGENAGWFENLMVAAMFLLAAYFVLLTWILGATIGQLLSGIRVLQTDHRRITFGQCVGRTALTVLVLWTYGAAFLSAIVPPGHRAAHDILSGTIVVRRHPR
jgi:uncharacterized RDD family membrane protein YckC